MGRLAVFWPFARPFARRGAGCEGAHSTERRGARRALARKTLLACGGASCERARWADALLLCGGSDGRGSGGSGGRGSGARGNDGLPTLASEAGF